MRFRKQQIKILENLKYKKQQLYNEGRMLDMPSSTRVFGNGSAHGMRTLSPTRDKQNPLYQRTLCLQRMPYEGNECRNWLLSK